MATVCNRSTGTTSCSPRGPTRVTECTPSQDWISAAASRRAASSAADTSGCRAAAIERDLGVLTTISANRGGPCRASPAWRGVPIDSPAIGSTQSTQSAYWMGVRVRAPIILPEPSTTDSSARATPPSR